MEHKRAKESGAINVENSAVTKETRCKVTHKKENT